jgi:hypothetical protein
MAVRTIRIVFPGQNTPGLGRSDSPEYARWLQKMSQAFASQGWRVVSQGPTMSSTNVDEDEFALSRTTARCHAPSWRPPCVRQGSPRTIGGAT